MSRVTVCRVCFASDVSMHHIRNTQIQEIFEKLTSKKLTDNSRPETICYLCYSQLQKCCKILELYQKTENVFEQLSCGGIEITHDTISFLKRGNILELMITPVRHIDVLPLDGYNDVTAVENLQHVTVKEEPIEVKVENIELSKEYDVVVKEPLYDSDYLESDDSTKDSTWHFETSQKCSKSRKERSENKKRITERNKKLRKKDTNIPFNSVIKTYTCKICNETFERRRELQQHTIQHKGNELYRCSDCNKAFTIKSNLQRHYTNVHRKTKHYTCDECDKSFTRIDHLRHHQRSHSGDKPYPCNICKMTFSSTSNVQQHVDSIHFNKKPFFCDKCDKSFSRKGNLQEHYRVHTGDKPFNCDKCDYKCSHLNTLKTHVCRKYIDGDD